MPLNTLKDLLIGQLHELYAGEKHGLQVIPRLEKAATAPPLAAALHRHAEQTREHVDRLEKALDELHVKPRRAESAGMKGLLADAIALAQDRRAEPHVRAEVARRGEGVRRPPEPPG
jgi:ferritin-like metal-binding protein YciE